MSARKESDGTPPVITTCGAMLAWARGARAAGRSIGFVPTMGALHEGHLGLVRASRAACDCTVVSIFVNPTQFGPREDFSRYPRTLAEDLQLLAPLGMDAVFAPEVAEMYGDGLGAQVDPPSIALPLEGECRPGHFRGVCTVVLKLFQIVPADRAYFGHKDYQQAKVIERMTADFNVPTQIEICPTVRDADGLAMSSRNRYLSAAEREKALGISRALRAARKKVEQGERNAISLAKEMRAELNRAGIDQIEYASVRDANTLVEVETVAGPAIALIACRVGATRLIDNERLK